MIRNSLDRIDLSALGPMSSEEMLAVIDGEDLNVYRAERAERDEIAMEAEVFRLAKPSDWPSLEFNWDLSPDSQRFALDGCKPDSFAKQYPESPRLGWVTLVEFDAKLSRQNRRGLAELWKVGDEDKLAMAIAYIRRGKPITPPLVAPLPEQMQVCLVGGNHRYTVAKFSGQVTLPIYVDPKEAERVAAIVPIRWL